MTRLPANARLVALSDLKPAEIASWRELAERADEPNPFHDPDFVLAAARGLGVTRDVAAMAVLDAEGAWVAAMPVERGRGWHGAPVPSLSTWLHQYSFLGAPLLAPDAPAEHMRSLTEAMLGASRLVGLDWLPAELADPEGVVVGGFERAVLRRRGDGDYLSGVKGKHRREFRRLARILEEQLGGELEIVDRTGEDSAVETFLQLEAAGWKGRDGTALASVPAHAEFFREVARSFRDRGAFELLSLEAAGTVAAMRCSLRAGGVGFAFKIAYDEELSRFSPGRELELKVIDRFHEDTTLACLDSCAQPGSPIYDRLWPDRRRLVNCAQTRSGPGGRALRGALRAGVAARQRRRERSGAQERSEP